MTTIKDDISSWLNSERDYNKGVQLFSKHSKNQNLIRLFITRPQNKDRHKMLTYQMSLLAGGVIGYIPKQNSVKTITHEKPTKTIDDELRGLLRTRTGLHSQLSIVKTKGERYELLHQIISVLTPKIIRLLELKKNPNLARLEEPKESGTSPEKVFKRKQNLRTYISKKKKEIKSEKDPTKKQRLENKLEEYQSELKKIENYERGNV